jgi:putative permease
MSRPAIRWLSLALLLLALTLVALTVLTVSGLARLLIISALLAYVLHPVASWLESLGLNRTGATLLVFLILGGLIAGLGLLLYPVLTGQLQALQNGEYDRQASAFIDRAQGFIRTKFAFLGLAKLDLAQEAEQSRAAMGKMVSKFVLASLFPSLTQLVAIPFISFFLLKDAREMKKWAIGLVPNRYFEFSLDLLYKMDMALGNFLRGQFLDALLFGLLTTLAMGLLHVKYFLFIGLFAGLANLIPYVGPIAGASLAVIDVLLTTSDLTRVAAVLLAFLIVKLLDDALIQPLTLARSVRMHPLIVLLAIFIGGHFFGILGMLLAVPAAGFLKVALDASLSLVRKYRFSRLI